MDGWPRPDLPWQLGHRLAEVVAVADDVVDGEVQMMRGDGSGDGGAAGPHGGDGGGGGAVLEDDAEAREGGVQGGEGGQEGGLGVEDGDVGAGGGGQLAVQVQHEVVLLHGREHGVEGRVVDDARVGVGRDAGRIGLDGCDAGGGGGGDGRWRDGRVQVERHEVGDVGLDGGEALLVGQGLGDGRDRGDEVGLWCLISLLIPIAQLIAPCHAMAADEQRRGEEGTRKHTITRTVSTPPARIVGTTTSIIAPSRRCTCMSALAGSSTSCSFSSPILALCAAKRRRVGWNGDWQLGEIWRPRARSTPNPVGRSAEGRT